MEADKVRYKLYSLGMARIEGGDNNNEAEMPEALET